MSISDAMRESRREEEKWRAAQRAKFGEYTGERCTNCRRNRVMTGRDGKRRCEKCAWCEEDAGYDGAFSSYLSRYL